MLKTLLVLLSLSVVQGEGDLEGGVQRALLAADRARATGSASHVLSHGGRELAVLTTDTVRGLRRVVHQREVVFHDGVRAVQTEEILGHRRRLVWREFRPDGARTWVAEWDRVSGSSSTTGYGWHRATHGSLGSSPEAEPPGLGVLELLDRIERGLVPDGRQLALVDPATASVLDVRVEVEGDVTRVVRRDGTLVVARRRPRAGADGELWVGAGPQTWRPVARARFQRLARAWRLPVRPAHEVVLAAFRRTGR